uniref:Uncharacterized protein n=1 Tax=Arundo donax TaxID=35708 RepID=A0A0A8YI09_ARUDO
MLPLLVRTMRQTHVLSSYTKANTFSQRTNKDP